MKEVRVIATVSYKIEIIVHESMVPDGCVDKIIDDMLDIANNYIVHEYNLSDIEVEDV